jgi:hypothetical protein
MQETPATHPELFIEDRAEVARVAKLTASLNVKDQRLPGDLQARLSVMSSDLYMEEKRLEAVSKEVVNSTGNLVKAESALKQFPSHSAFHAKVEGFRTLVHEMKKLEAKLIRLVAGRKRNIDCFLAEGTPTNEDIIRVAVELEKAERLLVSL